MCRKPEYVPEGLTAGELVRAEGAAVRRFYLRPLVLLKCLRFLKFSYIRKTLFRKLREYHVIK